MVAWLVAGQEAGQEAGLRARTRTGDSLCGPGERWCTRPRLRYPAALIQATLNSSHPLWPGLRRTKRTAPPDLPRPASRPACTTLPAFLAPRAARNTALQWRFVVNSGPIQQVRKSSEYVTKMRKTTSLPQCQWLIAGCASGAVSSGRAGGVCGGVVGAGHSVPPALSRTQTGGGHHLRPDHTRHLHLPLLLRLPHAQPGLLNTHLVKTTFK